MVTKELQYQFPILYINNVNDLNMVKKQIDILHSEIKTRDDSCFKSNGLTLRVGKTFCHKMNTQDLVTLQSLLSTVAETLQILEKAKERVFRIFPSSRQGNSLKRKSRMEKQNRSKAGKRKRERYQNNEESIFRGGDIGNRDFFF